MIQQAWSDGPYHQDPARRISAKFKFLRKIMKVWKSSLPSLSTTILRVKSVIHFLETLELLRDLSFPEWNFRNALYDKLVSLLSMQKTYWKQRSKIRWIKEGDFGTKFFHTHATIKHRKNTISPLTNDQEAVLTDHEQKAHILWESFEGSLGTSKEEEILFNLDQLIPRSAQLLELNNVFTREEIDGVISDLPLDKSPHLDGFNNEFIRKCWSFLAHDFYDLCEAFHSGNLCTRSINSSYITLIPKMEGPSRVNDFRPISLLNSSMKIITKSNS